MRAIKSLEETAFGSAEKAVWVSLSLTGKHKSNLQEPPARRISASSLIEWQADLVLVPRDAFPFFQDFSPKADQLKPLPARA